MLRRIIGFRQDDQGDWIADLSCLHSQHVRHQPPFQDRGWVLTESGRAARVGTELGCPLCDRAELPDRLRILRSIGPFDEETLPAGLRGDHRLADGIWGRLRVDQGNRGVPDGVGCPARGSPELRATSRQSRRCWSIVSCPKERWRSSSNCSSETTTARADTMRACVRSRWLEHKSFELSTPYAER